MNAPQRSVFLSPGEHFVGDARWRVRTLLGSCVSITLWQRERRIGAMSHFLLAGRGASRAGSAPQLDGRYGGEALQLMLQGLAGLGVEPAQCEAKLFGGGDMFPGQADTAPAPVGRRNGDAARAMLADHGIRLVSHSLFGIGHRKIVFDIATGDVWAWQESARPPEARRPECEAPRYSSGHAASDLAPLEAPPMPPDATAARRARAATSSSPKRTP